MGLHGDISGDNVHWYRAGCVRLLGDFEYAACFTNFWRQHDGHADGFYVYNSSLQGLSMTWGCSLSERLSSKTIFNRYLFTPLNATNDQSLSSTHRLRPTSVKICIPTTVHSAWNLLHALESLIDLCFTQIGKSEAKACATEDCYCN